MTFTTFVFGPTGRTIRTLAESTIVAPGMRKANLRV